MNKHISFTAIITALALFLCGCQNSTVISDPPNSAVEVSDPFESASLSDEGVASVIQSTDDVSQDDEETEREKNQRILMDAAFAISNVHVDFFVDMAEWINDETLKLPLRMEGEGEKPETEFCPLVFCDGILVQTSMDGEKFGYSECRIVCGELSQSIDNITHEIYLKPVFDSSLATHHIMIAYIQNPDARPDDYWMISGYLVEPLCVGSDVIDIPEEHMSVCKDIDKNAVLAAEPSTAITEEQKLKFKISDDTGACLDVTDPDGVQTFSDDGKHQSNIMLAENSDKVKFTVYGGSVESGRTLYKATVFVNNKPVKFNGGYESLTFMLEGGKISMTDIEINGLKDKDIVYVVFCPLASEGARFLNSYVTSVHLVERK